MATTPRSVTLERAEHARAELAAKAFQDPNVTAVGLSARGDGYVVRIRVAGVDDATLPDSFEGVPVEVVADSAPVVAQADDRPSALRRLALRFSRRAPGR